jgi:hypothetical protein
MRDERGERKRERLQHSNGILAGGNQGSDVPNRRVGWGTSELMLAKLTDDAGSWLRIGCEVDLECGAFDGTTRQSG